MYAFEFVKPKTVEEAVAALAAEEAQALGGGQTLIPTLRQRLAQPGTLVALSGIAAIKGVTMRGAARHRRRHHPRHRGAEARRTIRRWHRSRRIGDPHVRNRGTIGGSLANNDPSACYPAGGARLGRDDRDRPSRDRRRRLLPGHVHHRARAREIITEVRFPIPERARYEKFIQRASRFPLVPSSSPSSPTGSGSRSPALGGRVFRWGEAEAALAGDFRPEAVKGLRPETDGMIGDLHGTPSTGPISHRGDRASGGGGLRPKASWRSTNSA